MIYTQGNKRHGSKRPNKEINQSKAEPNTKLSLLSLSSIFSLHNFFHVLDPSPLLHTYPFSHHSILLQVVVTSFFQKGFNQ